MPHKIQIERPACGYAAEPSGPDQNTVRVIPVEFSSSEDGQHFIKRLEGATSEILEALAKQGNRISPSSIDHLLAFISPDGDTTVYVNELTLSSLIRVNRAIEKGETVTKNDIIDIHSLDLGGITNPGDAGIVFVFSIGWRRGLFFDYRPLRPHLQTVDYDLETTFGQFYSHVLFQERFGITDDEWNRLFDTGWFPFNSISFDNAQAIVDYARHDWEPSGLLDKLLSELTERIPSFRESWRGLSIFDDHIAILEHALTKFEESDYISCVSILYPRIEGLLRSHHSSLGQTTSASQRNLAESAVARFAENDGSLLLPRRFRQYLENVYFRSFDPANRSIECSRNSVGHGVADQQQFNLQSAIIAILVVHQLFYYFAETDRQTNVDHAHENGA